VIGQSHGPIPDKTQHSQEANIHAPSRLQTRNPRNRAAADPRLRPRGICTVICSSTNYRLHRSQEFQYPLFRSIFYTRQRILISYLWLLFFFYCYMPCPSFITGTPYTPRLNAISDWQFKKVRKNRNNNSLQTAPNFTLLE